MSSLQLKGIKKHFDKTQVINGVDLKIDSGEFIVFVGPSGCGKSTLLRLISGLEDVSGGEIHIGDVNVTNVSPSKRGIAMVFQSYALFPHMSVAENMTFGLRLAKTEPSIIKEKLNNAAEILQIHNLLNRKPKALSGGQRQRVAIGRAIMRDPKVFLFDEPLSNLDASLRVQMRVEIAKLHSELSATMVYVTHDQVEAMTLADRIVVINAGLIEQVGSPLELYENPANVFVAGFIGSPKMNFFRIARQETSNGLTFGIDDYLIPIDNKFDSSGNGNSITVGIRPEDFSVCNATDAKLSVNIDMLEKLGSETLAYFKRSDSTEPLASAKVPRDYQAIKGDTLHLTFNDDKCYLFDENGLAISRQKVLSIET